MSKEDLDPALSEALDIYFKECENGFKTPVALVMAMIATDIKMSDLAMAIYGNGWKEDGWPFM